MRRALTLIELVVVIGIIGIIAAALVLIRPASHPEVEGATRLQGWLVEARSKALRDQRPVGLQVLNGVPSLIEQPDDWVPPVGATATFAISGSTITVTLSGAVFPAAAAMNDFLEKGTGTSDIAIIKSVTPTTLTCALQPGSTAAFWTSGPTSDWRLVFQPKTALGATPLPWPEISLTPDQSVLFSPSGGVVGSSAPVRWIIGGRLVLQVSPGTGAVQINPVAPGADPFLYCRDGRSSGF